jgi:putative endonuclease
MHQFTTYILYSKILDAFYIGFTGDVVNIRLAKHLSEHKGYTAKAKDWAIVYTEIFNTKSEAMQREKQFKAWKSKIRIRQFINRKENE